MSGKNVKGKATEKESSRLRSEWWHVINFHAKFVV